MMRIAIVEDNAAVRRQLRTYIDRYYGGDQKNYKLTEYMSQTADCDLSHDII